MHRNAWPIDLALLMIAIVDSDDNVVVQVSLYIAYTLEIELIFWQNSFKKRRATSRYD